MNTQKSNRTRRVTCRFSIEEFNKLDTGRKNSTCRTNSDYIRHLLFSKPIVTTYRNQSADDYLTEMSRLRTELNHVGNNFNQMVKRLHTLSHLPEFKAWITTGELQHLTVQNKIEEIKKLILKMVEIWLQ